MQATKPFHSVNQIPDGATLKIEASSIAGNVQADAHFMSGSEAVLDAEWSLPEMEAGTATTALGGPGLSMLRVRVVMAQGSKATFDAVISDGGQEIRRRTWSLTAEGGDDITRIGLIINVLGGA